MRLLCRRAGTLDLFDRFLFGFDVLFGEDVAEFVDEEMFGKVDGSTRGHCRAFATGRAREIQAGAIGRPADVLGEAPVT